MTRRKTKKILGGSATKALRARSGSASRGQNSAKEMRFNISLLILIALLCVSAYLFVMVLAWNWPAQSQVAGMGARGANANVAALQKAAVKPVIDDSSLDYKLTIPVQFKGWIYKTGSVKDPIDDTIADQYLKIYFPLAAKSASTNFDAKFADVLTILKFPKDSWAKLDKSCQKGDSAKCDMEGTKISETSDAVFAYIKSANCPKEIQAVCANAQKIVDTFQLK